MLLFLDRAADFNTLLSRNCYPHTRRFGEILQADCVICADRSGYQSLRWIRRVDCEREWGPVGSHAADHASAFTVSFLLAVPIFAATSLLLFVSLNVGLPYLRHMWVSWFWTYNLVLALPMFALVLFALLVYRSEGRPFTCLAM
jgi:hypothetical protein